MFKSLLIVGALALCANALAQVPGTLSYQGILLQNDGITPISDGSHSIVFSFYTTSSGGSALFTRTVAVNTTKGLYTCIIGGGTGANAPFGSTEMNQLGSQQVYVGIALDGGGELSPRAQLTTTPYSLRAQSVVQTANATGGNVAFWGTNNTLATDAGLAYNAATKGLSVTGGVSAASVGTSTGAVSATGSFGNIRITGSPSPSNADGAPQSESAIFIQRGATGGVKNGNTAEIKLSTWESGINGRTSLEFWLSGLPNNENGFGSYGEVPVLILHGDDLSGTSNQGRVGIGTQLPTTTLSVNGDANKISGGTWGTFSDIRLKENVRDFTDGLNVLVKINPKIFRYNGLGGIKKSEHDEIGIIAQEVEPVAPYMIQDVNTKLHPTDSNDTALKMFDGGNDLIFILVNAVKEQQAQIEDLKKQVAELKRLAEVNAGNPLNASTGRH